MFRWGKRRLGSDIVEAAGVPTNEYGRPKWGFKQLQSKIGFQGHQNVRTNLDNHCVVLTVIWGMKSVDVEPLFVLPIVTQLLTNQIVDFASFLKFL